MTRALNTDKKNGYCRDLLGDGQGMVDERLDGRDMVAQLVEVQVNL